VVTQFHGDAAAQEADREFEKTFQQGDVGDDVAMPEVPLARLPRNEGGTPVAALLVQENLVSSMSDARRLLKQGAVERNGKAVTAASLELQPGDVLRVGKHRFLRIVDSEKT
jgi:tyrosyl-tRNA synthetase